jgi:hypothetical protein
LSDQAESARRLRKLWVDVYEGRDLQNHSILSRLATLEKNMTEEAEDRLKIENRREAKMNALLTAVFALVVAAIVKLFIKG